MTDYTTGNLKMDEKIQKALQKEKVKTYPFFEKIAPVKKNKYSNTKTVVDNITFDSKKEAERYLVLRLEEKAGEISNLQLQPKFILQLGFTDYMKRKRKPIFYIADFMYITRGQKIVEDVKGIQTKEYKVKKKLFLFKYPHLIFQET